MYRSTGRSLKRWVPRQCLRVSDYIVREEFQRHVAVQPRVLRLVNKTHATTAELFENAIVRNRPADE
jgi:hypothetical protein